MRGEVRLQGSRRGALSLLAATLLAPGVSVLRNVPLIGDVRLMRTLLQRLGVRVVEAHEGDGASRRALVGDAPAESERSAHTWRVDATEANSMTTSQPAWVASNSVVPL